VKRREIPLFPLNAVLFPGSTLGLRIFEARYLDMVRECARSGRGFGVCLIMQGQEAGEPALPAAVGTLASIVDFDTLPDGLLGISVTGGARFRVQRSRIRGNGLVIGEVRGWPDEPVVPVPLEFSLLPAILERLAEQSGLSWRNGPANVTTMPVGSVSGWRNCCRWVTPSASICWRSPIPWNG